jgi:hypothetical protein
MQPRHIQVQQEMWAAIDKLLERIDWLLGWGIDVVEVIARLVAVMGEKPK